MAEKLQAQLFQARDSADKERTQLVERAARAEAALTDTTAELGTDMALSENVVLQEIYQQSGRLFP